MSGVLGQLVSNVDTLNFDKPIQLSGRVSRFDGHIIECDGFRRQSEPFVRLVSKKVKQPMPRLLVLKTTPIFCLFMIIMRKSALVPR